MDKIELIFLGVIILIVIAGIIGFAIWEYKDSIKTEKKIEEMEKELEESRKRREEEMNKIAEIICNNLTDEQKAQLAKIIEEIESL